jgi:predicted RNase H-like HicB family nuclease
MAIGGLAGSRKSPGVNSQGLSRTELIENLRSALQEAIEMNREEARAAAVDNFTEEKILV